MIDKQVIFYLGIILPLLACDPQESQDENLDFGQKPTAGSRSTNPIDMMIPNTAVDSFITGGTMAGEMVTSGTTAGHMVAGESIIGGEMAGGDPTCMTTEDFYTEVAWSEVFQVCAGCHGPGLAAGQTRLIFDSDDSLSTSYPQLVTLINESINNIPILLLKPTGLHPDGHGGGRVLSLNNDDRLQTLIEFTERVLDRRDECGQFRENAVPIELMPVATDCGTLQPGRRLLRRLSHEEYRHTIFDLLEIEIDAKAAFVADPNSHGFDNPPDLLNVSSLLVNQYREMAEQIGEQVTLDSWLPCELSEGNIHCAQQFIINFGQRAFRRPLTQEEVNRYLEIYRLVVAQECFEQGIRWVIIGMLQSPHFLYRSELGWLDGNQFKLSAYEIASELSYLIWQSMPDDELFQLAAQGELLDPQVVQNQLERMLTDPRSVRTAQYFIERWLHLDRLMQVTRDSIIYAALYFELREMMLTETRIFVEELWKSTAEFSSLFLSNHSWINQELADYYELELGEQHSQFTNFYRTGLDATRPAGILTQGAFLTTHAAPTSSSPILRGVTLREQILCDHLDPPPEGLEIIPPSFDPNLSTRERFAAHTEDPLCASCHTLIDPLGFAFENYDGIGRYRLTEGESELMIDSSGNLETTSGEVISFSGIGELSNALAQDTKVHACYVKQWLRFGIGETEGLDSECYTAELLAEFQGDQFSLQSPIQRLTALPHFYYRSGNTEERSLPGEEYLVKEIGGVSELTVDPLPDDVEETACGIPPSPSGGSAGVSDARILVSEREDRWSTGYCRYITVQNTSMEQIDGWVVELVVEGTINNAWNVERTADTGSVQFSPLTWNSTLYPESSIEFGFCGQL